MNCGFKEKFVRSFGEVLSDDYDSRTFSFEKRILEMECLDLDRYDHSENGIQDGSMDCAVSVSSFNLNSRKHSNHRVLLVEFKLDCTSKNTLGESELLKKELHSREILSSFNISADLISVFIFPKNLKSVYKSKVERWKRGSGGSSFKYWEITTPVDFNEFIKFEENYPYMPVNKAEKIIYELRSALDNGTEPFLKVVEQWYSQASICADRYQLDEFRHIMRVLSENVPRLIERITEKDDREFIESEDYFMEIMNFSD